MKKHSYPTFRISCLVCVHLAGSETIHPDIKVKVGFYAQHHDDVQSAGKREAIWRLERLGVAAETLKDAYFETEDHSYIAVNAKGIRREYGIDVEAFRHCDTIKKRDVLIKQQRLVPDDHSDMVAMYGPAPKIAQVAA